MTAREALAQEWRDRLEDFAQSEMTVQQWCDFNVLPVHQYYYWRRRLANSQIRSQRPSPPGWPSASSNRCSSPDHSRPYPPHCWSRDRDSLRVSTPNCCVLSSVPWRHPHVERRQHQPASSSPAEAPTCANPSTDLPLSSPMSTIRISLQEASSSSATEDATNSRSSPGITTASGSTTEGWNVGAFSGPNNPGQESIAVSRRQLQWLLDGLSLEQRQAHPPVNARIAA